MTNRTKCRVTNLDTAVIIHIWAGDASLLTALPSYAAAFVPVLLQNSCSYCELPASAASSDLEQITMLCSASLSALRSAGWKPAWRPGWPPSQAGSHTHPLPGRLGQARILPDERGLARLQRIV